MKTALLAMLILVSAQAFALDLKGVELGKPATAAQLKAAFGATCNHGGKLFGEALPPTCKGRTQIDGVFVDIFVVLTDKGGRVSSITAHFDTNFYGQMERAARAKYGAPDGTDHATLQNGFGARFDSQQLWWNDADGAQVNLFSHISATEGQLLLESASLRAADKAKQEAERAKSKM